MTRYMSHYPVTNPAHMVVKRSAKHIRAHAEKYFKGRLLDIGCGSKRKLDLVGDLVEEYLGLDHADTKHDTSKVDIFGTAWDIPVPDNSFDCVLSTSVLEHLEEPEMALRESLRVLRPGGHALYTVPFFWHLHEQPRDFFRYSRYGLRYLFEKVGYDIAELEPLSGFWLTIGSEWNYYLLAACPRTLRPLARLWVVLSNVLVPMIDALDTRLNARSREWTWMNLVVARKP